MNTETATQDLVVYAPSTTSAPDLDSRGNIQPRRTDKGTDAYLLAVEPSADGSLKSHQHSLRDRHYVVEKVSDGFTLCGHRDGNCWDRLPTQHYAPETEWGIMQRENDADGNKVRAIAAQSGTSLRGHDITQYGTVLDAPPTDNQPSLRDILTELQSMMDESAGRG